MKSKVCSVDSIVQYTFASFSDPKKLTIPPKKSCTRFVYEGRVNGFRESSCSKPDNFFPGKTGGTLHAARISYFCVVNVTSLTEKV